MKKRLSLPRKILLALAILLVLYLIPCVYVSARLHGLVQRSYDFFGENNPNPSVICNEAYADLNCRAPEEVTMAKDQCFRHTFPLTVLWPGGGKSVYWYTFEATDANGSLLTGSWHVDMHITYRFQNGHWVVTDVYEPA